MDENYDENRLKLKYLDCFLTRYVYHSFERWFYRMKYYYNMNQK